jgi:serine/threonine-protein kinase
MGVVYEAHDPALARDVALKVIQPFALADESARETFEQRFLSEARISGRLSHPGIVVVHDVGRDQESGALYIALERLRGRTLAAITDAGRPFDWRQAVRIVAGVARALDHAHAQGVVHRDMKPANVMVLENGEAKIMDFGVATLEEARVRLTAPGDFLGTPLYMAPEQALGEPVDRRTDLFSLGAIAYTLLTGRPPFEGANMAQVVARVVKEDPAPPSSLVPGIPPRLDRILVRAMAKAPADRYQDGRSLAEDLEAVLESARGAGEVELVLAEDELASTPAATSSPPPPLPASATEPAGPLVGSRTGASAAALLAALVLLFGIVWWREAAQPTPAPSPPLTVETAPAAEPPADPAPAPPPEAAGTAAPEPVRPAAKGPGRLAIDLEHPLESGVLRVWVDSEMVVEEKLSGRVSKNALVFKLRKGSYSDVLEVSPGRHQVRVQIQWEDNTRTEQVVGSFWSGVTRRLQVRLGRLRKNLTLEWS